MKLQALVGEITTLSLMMVGPTNVVWSEDSGGAVVSLVDAGDGTATALGVSLGMATVTAAATDQDGLPVIIEPFQIEILEAREPAIITVSATTPTVLSRGV